MVQPWAQRDRRATIARCLTASTLILAVVTMILVGRSRAPIPGTPVPDPAHSRPVDGTCVSDLGPQVPLGGKMLRAQVNSDPTFGDCSSGHIGEVIAVATDVSRDDVETSTVCNHLPDDYLGVSPDFAPG